MPASAKGWLLLKWQIAELLILLALHTVDAICPGGCTCFASDRVMCADVMTRSQYDPTAANDLMNSTTVLTPTHRSSNNDLSAGEDQVVYKWDVEACSNDTCPRHSKCFDVHPGHSICRCDPSLVWIWDGRRTCTYGRKIFIVDGLVLKMKYKNGYQNTSSMEFLRKAEEIRKEINLLISRHSAVIGSQVTRIYQKHQGSKCLTLIEFILSFNNSALNEINIHQRINAAVTNNGTILNVDLKNSRIAVKITDICELKGQPCDKVTELCVYGISSGLHNCACANGYEKDEIDLVCADKSEKMELTVVIPVCGVVVVLLCLGGYMYNKRYSSPSYTRSGVSVVSFSNTSF